MKPSAIGVLVAALAAGCAPGRAPSAERLGAAGEAVRQCPKPRGVPGVDVSYHQGRVDWAAARAGGVAFAFARVADGLDVLDPAFAANWPGMKAAGVIRGAYQFFRPAEDPLAQAAAFLREIDARGGLHAGDLPPALDLEVTDGVPRALVRARARAWLARVEAATGRTPIVYTSPGFWGEIGDDEAFARYTLWLAHWETACPVLPGSWSRFRFWQDATDRDAPGIAAPVDTDWFDGTQAELERFAAGPPEPLASGPKQRGHTKKAKTSVRPAHPRSSRRPEPVGLESLLRVLTL